MFGLPVTHHGQIDVMTTDHAHLIMQAHKGCDSAVCAVKRQAKHRLIEEGRFVEDSHRNWIAMGY